MSGTDWRPMTGAEWDDAPDLGYLDVTHADPPWRDVVRITPPDVVPGVYVPRSRRAEALAARAEEDYRRRRAVREAARESAARQEARRAPVVA